VRDGDERRRVTRMPERRGAWAYSRGKARAQAVVVAVWVASYGGGCGGEVAVAVLPRPGGCGGERTDTPAARLSEVRTAARHSRARHDRGPSTLGAAAVHGDDRVPNGHEGGCIRLHRGGSVGGADGGDLNAAAAPRRLQWKLSDSHLVSKRFLSTSAAASHPSG